MKILSPKETAEELAKLNSEVIEGDPAVEEGDSDEDKELKHATSYLNYAIKNGYLDEEEIAGKSNKELIEMADKMEAEGDAAIDNQIEDQLIAEHDDEELGKDDEDFRPTKDEVEARL
jgi:hypothetical protein